MATVTSYRQKPPRFQDQDTTRREGAAGSHGSRLGSSRRGRDSKTCAWHCLERKQSPSAASLMVVEWTMPMQHLCEPDLALAWQYNIAITSA